MQVKWYIWIVISIFVFIVGGCNSTEPPQTENRQEVTQTASNDVTSLNWRIPEFKAVDHTGKAFTHKDVQGDLWLADLIFTRCNTVCPPMTANLSKVQKDLKEQGVDIKIVSFSVDPEYDKPEILTEYAKKYQADLSNWYFLTGYTYDEINQFTQTAFKGVLTKSKGPSPEVPIMINHSTRYYLIDGEGKVRKFYDGLQPDSKKIAEDIQQLQNK